MTEHDLKHMANRFLGWRLPEHFGPDNGISFKPAFNEEPMRSAHWPVGTNLFSADQAEAMVRFMAEGLTPDHRITALEEERDRLSDILDTERYKVAIGLQEIRKALDGRRWLSEAGRGSYTYDDERYQQEFGAALDEIDAALEPFRKIAGDWSDCPRDPLRVAANRSAALTKTTQDKGERL